jgi:hypothetical protein
VIEVLLGGWPESAQIIEDWERWGAKVGYFARLSDEDLFFRMPGNVQRKLEAVKLKEERGL